MYGAQGHQFKQFYMATNGYIQAILGNCCLLILVIVYYLWSELVTMWQKILDCMIPSMVQKVQVLMFLSHQTINLKDLKPLHPLFMPPKYYAIHELDVIISLQSG